MALQGKNIMQDTDQTTDELSTLEMWEEIRIIVESIDLDLRRSVNKKRKNASAGVRARKGLRILRDKSHVLLMNSVKEKPKRNYEKSKQDT